MERLDEHCGRFEKPRAWGQGDLQFRGRRCSCVCDWCLTTSSYQFFSSSWWCYFLWEIIFRICVCVFIVLIFVRGQNLQHRGSEDCTIEYTWKIWRNKTESLLSLFHAMSHHFQMAFFWVVLQTSAGRKRQHAQVKVIADYCTLLSPRSANISPRGSFGVLFHKEFCGRCRRRKTQMIPIWFVATFDNGKIMGNHLPGFMLFSSVLATAPHIVWFLPWHALAVSGHDNFETQVTWLERGEVIR